MRGVEEIFRGVEKARLQREVAHQRRVTGLPQEIDPRRNTKGRLFGIEPDQSVLLDRGIAADGSRRMDRIAAQAGDRLALPCPVEVPAVLGTDEPAAADMALR